MWPIHCVQNSDGAKIHKDLIVKKSDHIVKKGMNPLVDSYSGFYDNDHKVKSNLDDILKKEGVTDVFVTGIAYDYCVGYSALDARGLGYRVFVVEDATRGVADESTKQMILNLKKEGVIILKSSEIPDDGLIDLSKFPVNNNDAKKEEKKDEKKEDKKEEKKDEKKSENTSPTNKNKRNSNSSNDKKRKSALLIIDVQNDFIPPKGSLAVNDGDAVIPVINELRKRVSFDLIALTQDWHPKNHISFQENHKDDPKAKLFTPYVLENGQTQVLWPVHCVQESEGAKLSKSLVVNKTDKIVKKGMNPMVDSYSGFYDNDHKVKSELEDILKKEGITDVYLTGLAYDYCVGFSALDAKSAGFNVYLLEDATRGVAPESTKDMIANLNKAGVSIIKSSTVPASGLFD